MNLPKRGTVEFHLSEKRLKANRIKVADSELTRIIRYLRPERCLCDGSEFPFLRDLVELTVASPDNYEQQLLKTGGVIRINGEPFKRIICSAGHARSRKVLFLHTAVWDEVTDIQMCGLDANKPFAPTKINAYMGLIASESFPLAAPPRMVVVEDCKKLIGGRFDRVLVNANLSEYEVKKDQDYQYETNLFDGAGLISLEMATAWSKEVKLNYTPAAWQFRAIPGVKGCLFTFDIKDFAKRHGVDTITDIWGAAHSCAGIDVILTRSQFKFHALYENFEAWERAFDTPTHGYRRTFNISSFTKNLKNLAGDVPMAYQMIQTLNLSKQEIKQLARATTVRLKELYADPTAFVKYVGAFSCDEGTESETDWYQVPPYYRALAHNPVIASDEFIFEKIKRTIRYAESRACAGKLTVKGNYQILAPDIFALAQHAFGLEVTGILRANEIYSAYWNTKRVDEVDMLRNPHVGHEHNIMHLHQSKMAAYWYQHQTATIVTSIYDNAVLRLGGADFDGDTVLTTKNRIVKDAAKRESYNTVIAEIESADSKSSARCALGDINQQIRADTKAFLCNIGNIVNPVTKLWSLPQSPERDRAIAIMIVIAGLTIDSAKTGEVPVVPKEIQALYKNVKKPYFMKHLESVNDDALWEDRDCTMNRVCRYVEDELEPYRVLQSNEEYNPAWLICKEKPYDHRGSAYRKTKAVLVSLHREYNTLCQERQNARSPEERKRYDVKFACFFSRCRCNLMEAYYGNTEVKNAEGLLDCVLQLYYYDADVIVGAGIKDKSILWHAFPKEMLRRVQNIEANKDAGRETLFERLRKSVEYKQAQQHRRAVDKKFNATNPFPIFSDIIHWAEKITDDPGEQRIIITLDAWGRAEESGVRRPMTVIPNSRTAISKSALGDVVGMPGDKAMDALNSLAGKGVLNMEYGPDGSVTVDLCFDLPQSEEKYEVNGVLGLHDYLMKNFS